MNYETAEQLKKAGFPQTTKHGWDICKHGNTFLADKNACCTLDEDCAALPTLSELIEACGPRFASLGTYDGIWCAYAPVHVKAQPERGATPEEAVARLWLALNKKV